MVVIASVQPYIQTTDHLTLFSKCYDNR